MQIENSHFRNNSALAVVGETSGFGGGIYYTCQSSYNCRVILDKNNTI